MRGKATVNLYDVMVSGMAGLAAGGLVGGLGARLAMRAVAIIGGLHPEFTVGGTVGIMIVGAILGLIFGLIYGVIRPFIPVRGLWRGLAFGVLLAVLISLPFFGARGGELLLASPVVGASLFAAVGLVGALALEAGLLWLDGRGTARPRRPVALVWLVPFAFFLTLAFAGTMSLADEFVRFPPTGSDAYLALGMDYQVAHQLHGFLMVAFALLYCGLAVPVFLQAGDNRAGNLAALALVVLAGGWFRAEPLTAAAMTSLPLVRSLPALVNACGLALIVLTLYVWPDGRLEPGWTKAAMALWSLWLLGWLVTPLRSLLPLPAPLLITAGFVISGLAASALRIRHNPAQRRLILPVLIGFSLAGVLFLALWLAALIEPDLRVREVPLPETLFVFVPYLLPWLLLPLSLLLGLRAASRLDIVTAPEVAAQLAEMPG